MYTWEFLGQVSMLKHNAGWCKEAPVSVSKDQKINIEFLQLNGIYIYT